VRGGWLRVDRAKEMIGETPEDGDKVYLRSSSVVEVGPDAPEPVAVGPPPAAAPGPALPPDTEQPTEDVDEEPQKALSIEGKAASERGIVRRLLRESDRLTARVAGSIEAGLEALGKSINVPVRDRKDAKDASSDARFFTLEGGEIVQVDIPTDVNQTFKTLYEASYRLIFDATVATIEDVLDVPIGVNLADDVARGIIERWATRKGLADVQAQTRDAVMAALRDGREAGDGAAALAKRIRGMVEGRHMYPGVYKEGYERAIKRGWSEAKAVKAGDRAARQYRAETIARTETKTAQNYSSIEAYRASEVVEALIVYDGDDCGWTGHDDPELANGKVVTFDEAAQNPLAHPRCVRSFAPKVRKTVE
jgi:hypothetical protein